MFDQRARSSLVLRRQRNTRLCCDACVAILFNTYEPGCVVFYAKVRHGCAEWLARVVHLQGLPTQRSPVTKLPRA